MAQDPGDIIFDLAAHNQIDSGPGGVTRDRAIDLARQGLPIDRALAQAEAETSSGKNPRDPHHSGDPQAVAAAAPATTNAPLVPTQSTVMNWLMASAKPTALIAGVPNWGVVAGGVAVLELLKGRHR